MRALNTLNFILYVGLFPFVCTIPLIIVMVIKVFLNFNETIPTYTLLGEETLTANNPIPLIITLILYVIVSIANAYGLLLLYKITQKFKKLQLFHPEIISYLKQMGDIFSLGHLLIFFLKLIINIEGFVLFNTNTYNLGATIIDNPINGFVIGLFFLILSSVFQIAKNQKEENVVLKEENELTI